jgi:hypothetical protein
MKATMAKASIWETPSREIGNLWLLKGSDGDETFYYADLARPSV